MTVTINQLARKTENMIKANQHVIDQLENDRAHRNALEAGVVGGFTQASNLSGR